MAALSAASVEMSGTGWPAGTATATPRAHQIGAAARPHMAAGDQFVDGVTGQHHAVKGFARLHALGRIHAADRLDLNLNVPGACALYSATRSAKSGLVAMEEISRSVVMVCALMCGVVPCQGLWPSRQRQTPCPA